MFPGDPKDVAERLCQKWLEDPGAVVDPLQGIAAFCREGAAHHARFAGPQVEATFEYVAELVEAVIREIRTTAVDYDTAAEMSPLARGTVKNKKKDFGEAPRGKVLLADLPLKPTTTNAGAHAARLSRLMGELKTESKEAARARSVEADEDESWADDQLKAM